MTTKTKAKQSDRSDVAILLDIYSLLPNPYQPESRVAVSMEVGAQFGNSIKEHGLIQPIIVRLKDGEYEVGDGWLRVCGYRWLDGNDGSWSEIPGIVRDLTDQQMADLVMEANTIRKDLNPIELAGFYKRYLEDFGITQAELARRHHCSQGEIANTVRLLELPDDVRQKVISQEISEAGGRQLLRLNTRPELQANVFKDALERHETVTEIERSVSQVIWRESRCLNPHAEHYQDPPVFDLSACKECRNKVKAAGPWGRNKKEDRCLDPKCWDEKQQAAKQELLDKAWAEMKDKGDAAKIVTSDQLSYNEREDLDNYKRDLDNPAECDQCAKVALFKYHITDKDEPRRVCTDPACYRKKKTKRTKSDNVRRKQEDKALTAKLGEAFGHVQEHPRECLLLLARSEFGALSAAGRVDLLIMFSNLPTVSNGRLDMEKTIASLDARTFEELLQLAMAAYITNRRRNSWEQYSTRLDEKLAADFALITGAGGDKQMKKVKKTPISQQCSFDNCTLKDSCSHYKPGKTPKYCLAYETECTNYPASDGKATISWFHCKYLPKDMWPEMALSPLEISEKEFKQGATAGETAEDKDPLAGLIIQTAPDGEQHHFKLGDIEVYSETMQGCLFDLADKLGWGTSAEEILTTLKGFPSTTNAEMLIGILEGKS